MARKARALIEEEFDVRRQVQVLRSLSLTERKVA
jgi:hypothetical protein